MTTALILVIAVLANMKGIDIVLESFKPMIIFPISFALLGAFYRVVRKNERISTTLLAIAIFGLYSVVANIFNHVLLPRDAPPIDALLVWMDELLGYSWPAWVEYFGQYPLLVELLRHFYALTLASVLFAILALGMLFGAQRLHAYLLSLMMASLATILIWAVFPSAGASAYWSLDPAIEELVKPTVSTAYGAKLNLLIENGMPQISGLNTMGLIGSPSFHTVMVLLPIFFLARNKLLFAVFSLYAAITLPSILLHGGHNLMDVIIGAGLAILSVYCAEKLMTKMNQRLVVADKELIYKPN